MAETRKPVHLIKGKTGRDLIWEHICREKIFTIPKIIKATSMHHSSVREYINALTKAGYVKKAPIHSQKNEAALYCLVKTTPTAPRLRKDGTEVIQGRSQENMWRAMRLLKGFSAREISAASSAGSVIVSLKTAQSYCSKLCKAEYLRNENGRYILFSSKNTGPQPPMIQHNKNIYDPNLKKVVWPKKDNE